MAELEEQVKALKSKVADLERRITVLDEPVR